MKIIITILLILFSMVSVAQTELKLHLPLNARNAKDTSLFDYYAKLSGSITIDSTYIISAMVNYERDNGKEYYSYSTKADIKYAQLEYYKNTEKNIEYFSTSLFYPVRKWLKVGYQYLYTDYSHHLVTIQTKWKWIEADISFLKQIEKLRININPEYIINNTSFGIEIGSLYVDKKLKWNSGITIKFLINTNK